MSLPKEPIILLSYINTLLRDQYESLDELCASLQINKTETEKTLLSIEYRYDEEVNQFI